MLRYVGFSFLCLFSANILSHSISICHEEWKPYAYEEADGPKGIIVDKITARAKKLNVELSIMQMPHRRCVSLVKSNKVDFAMFVDQQDGVELLSTPIAFWDIAAITSADVELKSADDLHHFSGGTFIIAQDYDYPHEFLETIKQYQAEIVKVPYYLASKTEEQVFFHYVIKNQADVMLVDANWSRILKDEYDLEVNVSEFNLFSSPQYIGYFHLDEDKKEIIQRLIEVQPLDKSH